MVKQPAYPAQQLDPRRRRPYHPCRWTLDCLVQAAVVVHHGEFGAIDTCVEHAAEHRAWGYADRYDEPVPECMCLGEDPDPQYRDRVDYCPSHGTPAGRGTEMSPEDLLTVPQVVR
jgi:hypothetical protein